jgi:hypothetical protein
LRWGPTNILPGLTWNFDPPNSILPCKLGWQICGTVPSYRLKWGLMNSLPMLASNCDPSNFSLPSSYNYKHEHLALSFLGIFWSNEDGNQD